MPIPLNPRKSPVQLRKRLIFAIAAAGNRTTDRTEKRNIVPLPAWMQPIVYPLEDTSKSLPAQSPPEIAPALAVSIADAAIELPIVNEDLRAAMSGENVTNDAKTVCQASSFVAFSPLITAVKSSFTNGNPIAASVIETAKAGAISGGDCAGRDLELSSEG